MTNESQATKTRKAQTFDLVIWLIDEKDWSNDLALTFVKEAPNMDEATFNRYYSEYQDSQG